MSYTPSKHTTSNKPYGVQGLPEGARSYYYDDATFSYRPFMSVAEAVAYLDIPAKRTGHFSVIINTGGVLSGGILTGGINDEYWWKNGTADSQLILKQANVDLSNYYTVDQTQTLLFNKVDKEPGKRLSTNDYTTLEQAKLAAISGINTGDQDLSGLATVTSLQEETQARIDGDTALGERIDTLESDLDTTNTTVTSQGNSLANITNTLLPLKADDANVVHKSTAETINDVKTFTSSPIVPNATVNNQALNLQTGRALPTDGIFSRNIGIIAKQETVNVTAGYSRNFLQITPANNYTHIKLFILEGNSQVRAYEFQSGYDSLNSTWKQLTPYLKYQDRPSEFEIDIRAVDGFGPTTFGILFRIRGITGAGITYRVEYHQTTPALGGDYQDYTKLQQVEYLTTLQPVNGLYPYQNQQATTTYVNQQDGIIMDSVNTKAEQVDVGDKTQLTTTDKDNLVEAINEVDARSRIVNNSFETVRLVSSTGTLRAEITTDTNGNVQIKSPTGEIMMELYQDSAPDDGLVDPTGTAGFPYTLPLTLS